MTFATAFRLPLDESVHLERIPTRASMEKAVAEAETAPLLERLKALQYRLYAENRRSLLICLQGMDTSGKDGVIRHVLGAMNPQGFRLQTFKVPTDTENAHDFLWRIHKVTPAYGEVVIFNRSHYEDVLVPRVHGTVPPAVLDARYAAINEFERHLANNGTHVLKFFLHISPEEQLERFAARLKNPDRQWKISESDYTERTRWADYRAAYETALGRCNTAHAPWFVIPADHKWFRDRVVAGILVEYLEALDMQLPSPRVDIKRIQALYEQEKKKGSTKPG